MEMVTVKTADLIGPALDWAVAQIEGIEYDPRYLSMSSNLGGEGFKHWFVSNFRPSTDWGHGGPLIEKYKPWISPPVLDFGDGPYGWDAEIYEEDGDLVIGHAIGGSTALISVCRAIVLANLGDELQVPADLL